MYIAPAFRTFVCRQAQQESCDKFCVSSDVDDSWEAEGSGVVAGVSKRGTWLRALAILLYRSSKVKKMPWATFSNFASSITSAAWRASSKRILTGAAS